MEKVQEFFVSVKKKEKDQVEICVTNSQSEGSKHAVSYTDAEMVKYLIINQEEVLSAYPLVKEEGDWIEQLMKEFFKDNCDPDSYFQCGNHPSFVANISNSPS